MGMLLIVVAGCGVLVVAAILLFLVLNPDFMNGLGGGGDEQPEQQPPESVEVPEGSPPEEDEGPSDEGPPDEKPPDDDPPADGGGTPEGDGGAGGTCGSLFCTDGAVRSGDNYQIGTRPRYQFQNGDDGHCGECSIQVCMTKYGVWIPQKYVREAASDNDVLVETPSYPTAFNTMKINAEQFKGSGYQAYMAWVKERLVKGLQCIIVYDFSGSTFDDYGHIVPVTGIQTSNPTGGYNANDTLTVHTHFTENTVKKKVGSYQCKGSKGGVESGGCVPNSSLTNWAWCIKGPKYLGIGPQVELLMDSKREGGTMSATVKLHGLTKGKSYKVYQFTSPSQVPSSPSAKLSGTPWKTVSNATSSKYSFKTSFPSGTPRWFIAVEG